MNALLGREVATGGRQKVASTCVAIEGVNVRVWDSPGLGDGTGNDENYLEEIESKITKKNSTL